MATNQDKLSKFFAKQDRKIQNNGYVTINEIAEKKHSRIQSVKMGSKKNQNNDDVNKSDDEWGQIDNEMSSSIGFLPTHTDISIFKLIDHKRVQQQKQKESQQPDKSKIVEPQNTTLIKAPVFNPSNVLTTPDVDSGNNHVQPQTAPQEKKPKAYRPGDIARSKNVKSNNPLSEILFDESQFPTL